jgi:hypothetical protein
VPVDLPHSCFSIVFVIVAKLPPVQFTPIIATQRSLGATLFPINDLLRLPQYSLPKHSLTSLQKSSQLQLPGIHPDFEVEDTPTSSDSSFEKATFIDN